MTSAAGFLFAWWPSRASAAPFALAWSVPEGCPSGDAIVDATQASLGESRTDAPPELFVQGTVTEKSGGFVIALALKDPSGRAMGEREVRVDGHDCRAIEDPTSLVLAMMIAVARPRLPARDGPEQPPLAQPSASPPPRVEKSLVPAPIHRAPPRFSLGVGAVASAGLFPVLGLGAALRGTYSPGSRLVLGIEASFEEGGSIRAGGGQVGFQLLAASALAGFRILRSERVELILGMDARAGVVRISSSGFSAPQDESRPAVLVGPGMLVCVKLLPHVFAEAFPQIEGVLIRDEFQLRDRDETFPIHRPAPVEARLSLGLGYEFP